MDIPMRVSVIALLALQAGCAFDVAPADPPLPDRARFDAEVYPVLLRDCGFTDCHGTPERFFQVYGPGGHRSPATTGLRSPPTADELEVAYARARSMLVSAARAEDTLLLRKPLEVDRGGAPHMGIDEHGRDVYPATSAAGYVTLLQWARTGFTP